MSMNETQLTSRQEKILSLLSTQPISRVELAQKLSNLYQPSKTTLYRDLKKLQSLGLVKSIGQSKSIKYISLENPLVKQVSLQSYFETDSTLRHQTKTSFDFEVFEHLVEIINDREEDELSLTLKNLSVQQTKLDPTIFKRELERFIIEFSWKSSHIEGNTYTLLETEILIKQHKAAVGRSKYETNMVLNHKQALDYILEHSQEFKQLTLVKILTLHNLLTQDLNISQGIRRQPVAITGTNYVPLTNSTSLQVALEKTITVINQVKFPVSKALIAVSMVAYIQPFADGNKRTSRVLANAILIAYDLYPLSYRNTDELEYLKAVLLFYEQNNLYHLKRIFLEQLEFATNNYFQ